MSDVEDLPLLCGPPGGNPSSLFEANRRSHRGLQAGDPLGRIATGRIGPEPDAAAPAAGVVIGPGDLALADPRLSDVARTVQRDLRGDASARTRNGGAIEARRGVAVTFLVAEYQRRAVPCDRAR